uniref:Uncharacterized protein n=1 Tax=Streptomyces sp. NBC_00119 TaxID=2975659 RepID=A0AAU1UMM5_9ACTN
MATRATPDEGVIALIQDTAPPPTPASSRYRCWLLRRLQKGALPCDRPDHAIAQAVLQPVSLANEQWDSTLISSITPHVLERLATLLQWRMPLQECCAELRHGRMEERAHFDLVEPFGASLVAPGLVYESITGSAHRAASRAVLWPASSCSTIRPWRRRAAGAVQWLHA